ncbi:hypothetical protein EB077_11220 [bacterium]|nr:hypothetical protein [bacterium]
MRVEAEIELLNGKKFLVYATLSKQNTESSCEVEFDTVASIDDNTSDAVTSEELDEIATILAYQYDDLKREYF